MRLTCNTKRIMMAIAAIAMFCAGTAMARETLFIKNSDKYVTQSGDDIYQMKAPLVQVTKACSEAGALDVKNGSVTAGNGYVDGAYKYGNVTKYECNTGVKTNYNLVVSSVAEDLTKAGAGRAVAFAGSVFEGTESSFYVLNEDMKTGRMYGDCPSSKVAGDYTGVNKDKTKCYEKVKIYDVTVACSEDSKPGDGKSPVYTDVFLISKHDGVKASKDRCYHYKGEKLYSMLKDGYSPSNDRSDAFCRDGFDRVSSGTYHTGEKDSVTAANNKLYCVKSTNTSFYRNPSDRSYVDNYSASVTRYEGCTYTNLNGTASDKIGSMGESIIATQNGNKACYMEKNTDGCFEIGSAFELYAFANIVNNARSGKICAKLTSDITVNDKVLDAKGELNGNGDGLTSWTPMNVYSGVKVTFDGNGHTISGLYFNVVQNKVGLFGSVNDSLSISNLGIVDSYFKGGYYVGGLVGYGYDAEMTITNSYNAGAVSGTGNYVGGLVGDVYNSTLSITNSYNAGSVNGTGNFVGGLVGDGFSEKMTITNSFFLATGKGGDDYGGTPKTSLDDFHNGAVAIQLHNWCEKDGDVCKEGGLNGSVWGQDLANANSLPDFSGSVGHKYGSIVFFYGEDDKIDSAYVDATSELAVDFPNNVVVSGPIKFKRTFAGSGYSTIMLPFKPNCSNNDCVEGVNFYAFSNYENATVGVSEVSLSDLQANTPYLVQAAGATEIVFKDGGTFNTTEGGVFNSETGDYKKVLDDGKGNANGWTIVGTYEYKTWAKGDAGLGKTYGFVGAGGNDASEVGTFKKVGAGAYIYPMRAYLEYDAPVVYNRPSANGTNSASGAVASLPDEIEVVIVDRNSEDGAEIAAGSIGDAGKTSEQTTRVIGTINTRTGEFKFATDRWFDLNGRYLGNKKPTQKGAYYNNGKKVIVK